MFIKYMYIYFSFKKTELIRITIPIESYSHNSIVQKLL